MLGIVSNPEMMLKTREGTCWFYAKPRENATPFPVRDRNTPGILIFKGPWNQSFMAIKRPLPVPDTQ